MKISSYIIFDFENGGINRKEPWKTPDTYAVTELAMLSIKGDTLEEITRMNMLVKPDYEPGLLYSEEAEKLTGITKQLLVKEGVDYHTEFKEEVLRVLQDSLLYSHYHKSVLVGQNVFFDEKILMKLFKDWKVDPSKYLKGEKDYYGNFRPVVIDTIELAKMAFGNDETIPNFQLGTIVEFFDQQISDGHRAINDVIPTKDVLVECIKRLRRVGSGQEEEEKYRSRTGFQF